MKRRMICAFLVLVLCLSLTVCVFAAPEDGFVVDEVGYLASVEVSTLNSTAEDIYDACGVGVFFVYTTSEELEDYDISALVGDLEDYVVMIENETSWDTALGGLGESIDDATRQTLRDAYDETETYVEGVDAYLKAVAGYFSETSKEIQTNEEEAVVFDDADLLTDAQEDSLSEKLLKISNTHNAQLVVATIASMDGNDVDHFVEYLYDAMGFGYGEKHDGVMLLVCMNPREYRILSNGMAADAIESNEIKKIKDAIETDLTDGNYADAFDEFADQCDYYLNGHLNGFPFKFGKNLIIALVIGIVAGLIVAFVLKGQLKSVRKQNEANVYVKTGSMQITERSDMFLYRNVTRTKKESSKSSSSGGGSRNVGGGSF